MPSTPPDDLWRKLELYCSHFRSSCIIKGMPYPRFDSVDAALRFLPVLIKEKEFSEKIARRLELSAEYLVIENQNLFPAPKQRTVDLQLVREGAEILGK